MKTAAEFYAKKNGGKSPRESIADGELISPIYACILMDEYASLRTVKLEELVGMYETYNQLSKQGEIRTKEELALWIALPERISELRKELNLK